MRIMVDTNVLVSALLFPRSNIGRVLEYIAQKHTLVLSSFVIEELRAVTARKFPDRAEAVERMLVGMTYEMVTHPTKWMKTCLKYAIPRITLYCIPQ